MRQKQHKIVNFKTFESKEESKNEFLSEDDIKEIFIELIDLGYIIKFINGTTKFYGPPSFKKVVYNFFELKKDCQSNFGWIQNNNSWGCTNFKEMTKEMSNLFTILDDIKERLNSMGYTIGFETEFSFSESSMFSIVCHMQHNSTLDDDDERQTTRPVHNFNDYDRDDFLNI